MTQGDLCAGGVKRFAILPTPLPGPSNPRAAAEGQIREAVIEGRTENLQESRCHRTAARSSTHRWTRPGTEAISWTRIVRAGSCPAVARVPTCTRKAITQTKLSTIPMCPPGSSGKANLHGPFADLFLRKNRFKLQIRAIIILIVARGGELPDENGGKHMSLRDIRKSNSHEIATALVSPLQPSPPGRRHPWLRWNAADATAPTTGAEARQRRVLLVLSG
jgi:hypothetical protein